MKKTTLSFLLFFISLPIYAETSYDPQTGNYYNVTPMAGGGAQVNGQNFNSGSQWHTTIQSNGNMQGTDADGNQWSYNRGTGSYYNYGTGESCIGEGAARSCS